ncbi:unnamed protein product [Trichobilharzia regenti]|nr:unnamed protein product [Trichobilharzia regenti]
MAIVQVSPNFEPLLNGCKRNRECWQILSENREVPYSLYGLDDNKDQVEQPHIPSLNASPSVASLGTLNPNSAERIAKSKPFTSPNIRRASVTSMTTVGGQEPTLTSQPSVETK